MSIRPLYDKVLVVMTEMETKSPGGIIVPDQVKDKDRPQKGVVIEVGEGRLTPFGKVIKPKVKPGDTILFNRYAGIPVEDIRDKKVVLMSEEQVLAIIEKD